MSDFTRMDAVAEAIKAVEGTHDFSAFTVERGRVDDPVRSIFKTELKEFGPLACLHFIGDGFLYKMVRSMAGTLVDIGRGRLPADSMKRILESCSRCDARDTAPGQGLFLLKVFYEHDEWKSHKLEEPPFMRL